MAKRSIQKLKVEMHHNLAKMHTFEATKELTNKGAATRHMCAARAHNRAAQMIRDNARSSRHPHDPLEAEAVAEELSARAMGVSPAEMRSKLCDIKLQLDTQY